LVFETDHLVWKPGRLHRDFHAVEIPWGEILRVQIEAPEDSFGALTFALSRRLAGYIRLVLWSGLVEFSIALSDAEAVVTHLNNHLGAGQIEIAPTITRSLGSNDQ